MLVSLYSIGEKAQRINTCHARSTWYTLKSVSYNPLVTFWGSLRSTILVPIKRAWRFIVYKSPHNDDDDDDDDDDH